MAVGIFGAVTGTVKNLNVENADISGDTSAMATGGVIGYLLSGKASGTNCTGGIVGGSFTGSLNNCSAKGTVTAEGNEPVGLGGIAGGVAEITFDEGIVSGIRVLMIKATAFSLTNTSSADMMRPTAFMSTNLLMTTRTNSHTSASLPILPHLPFTLNSY